MDRKKLENLQYGGVLKYQKENSSQPLYLIVEEVKNGKIHGRIASPVGVNAISIDELLEMEKLSIAEWN